MKIIYSGLRYVNYNADLGISFENENLYNSLNGMAGVDLIYFPYDRILEVGKNQFNAELLELTKREKPDLFFAVMFTDELEYKILEEMKKYTQTLAWFCDDHWRFDNYSKYYAPHFSWVATTYSKAIAEYKKLGCNQIIHTQWAANLDIYKPVVKKQVKYDVSFVGSWSRPRQKIIAELQKSDIKVDVYGSGWPAGRISEEKMIEIFSNSKINLGLNPAPGFFNINSLGRLILKRSRNKIVFDFKLLSNLKSWGKRGIPQIKARHFEIPACGGFLITSMADDLGSYYKTGEEIVIYENMRDMIDKINFYLREDDKRDGIAKAGYRRTLRDHLYKNRFQEIFKKII